MIRPEGDPRSMRLLAEVVWVRWGGIVRRFGQGPRSTGCSLPDVLWIGPARRSGGVHGGQIRMKWKQLKKDE